MSDSKYLTYSSYLKLDELLSLQQPRAESLEHDEMLFIIIHQVYELWFKEVLHELEYVCRMLGESDTPRALHTMKRVLTILKVLVAQLDILETMTPQEFLAFRQRLEAASGLESFQFRELEFLLGLKREQVFDRYPEGSRPLQTLKRRYDEPTLWDVFLRYLQNQGYDIPDHVLARDVTLPIEPSPEIQKVLIDVYARDAIIAQLCERLVDLDEGLQEWRYRHVKMVERTIGTKRGTGGTTGVEYLKRGIFHPCFPDLWEIRAQL